MLSIIRSARGYVRAVLHTRRIRRELDRVGLTPEVLEGRAAELDAVTPDFAQTRGKSWAEVGEASAAYLALLREVPDGAGAGAVIAHFRRAGRRGR